MRGPVRNLSIISLLALVLAAAACSRKTEPPTSIKLARTIPLPDVEGRIDHMAFDKLRNRLHVAARDNNSLETIDLEAGKVIHSERNLKLPQGVAVITGATPAQDRVVVSLGGEGNCWIGSAETLQRELGVEVGADPDNLRYHLDANLLYVAHDGGISAFNANDWKKQGEIAMVGHPESFQMDTKGGRLYANIPSAKQIGVFDRDTHAPVTHWSLQNVEGNYPMALDEGSRRIYVACRQPARLLMIDTTNGSLVVGLECAGDADDLYFDNERRRVYLSGGEGFLEVYQLKSADEIHRTARIATRAGARTCLYVAKQKKLYVAVPKNGAEGAEIRVFDVE
jgi:hypothetical protein